MKLSECKIGTIVQSVISTDDFGKAPIGHVVGLTKSFYTNSVTWKKEYEVIPVIQFVGEEKPFGFHHNNLELLA